MVMAEVEITSVDKAGRIVLPKETREKLGINERTKLLLAEMKGGAIILKKIDVGEMARQLEAELKDVNLENLFRKVREETNEKLKRAYPEIFT
jgi:AbrB family looped-hinge helix DNA binding protein